MNPRSVVRGLIVAALFFASPLLGLLAVGVLLLRHCLKPWRGDGWSHGSARLGTWADAKRGGLLGTAGLILGRATYLAQGIKGEQFLRLQAFTHLATFAATGRGKGVSVIIPNLLTYPRSVVVTDKAGENYRTTAEHRLRAFGQKQYRLDPFETCGPGGDAYNPLDAIDDASITFLDDCKALANLIVFRQGTEREPHWNDSAELMITAFIAFVCACSERRTSRHLLTVQRLLASPKKYVDSVAVMQRVTTHRGVIADLGNKLSWYIEKELSSVLSTVTRHLSFLASPAVAACVATSSFDPKELRSAGGASVYLCLAPDKMAVMTGLTRMWVGSLLHAATRALPTEQHPVLFFLDEAAHLGRIDALEQAVTLLRGVGIRLWFFFQSLNQVRQCYGDAAGTILDNIDTQQYFGINSFETAEALAKRIGDATILDESRNDSYTDSEPKRVAFAPPQPGSVTRSSSVTRAQIARKVFCPDEISRLPEDVGLVFHRNLPVLPVMLPKYYCDPEFAACLGAPHAAPALPGRRRRWRVWQHLRQPLLGLGVSSGCMALVVLWGAWHDPYRPSRYSPPPVLTKEQRQIAEERRRVAELERQVAEQAALGELEQRRMELERALGAQNALRGIRAYEREMPPEGVPACPDPARCPHAYQPGPHSGFGPHQCPNPAMCPHLIPPRR